MSNFDNSSSCYFQPALFLTDSQSALVLLSTAPAFFQPKSWDIWALCDSSPRVAVTKLPVGPRLCWTPLIWQIARHNELPDSLAIIGVTLPFPCSQPASPIYYKDGTPHPLCYLETKSFSLLPDSFGFLRGTGSSPLRLLWTVSTSLPWSQPSFVLLIKRKEKRIKRK